MSSLSEAQKEILMIEYFYPNSGATTVSVHLNLGKREVDKTIELIKQFMNTHECFRMKLRKEKEDVQRYYVDEIAPIPFESGSKEDVQKWIDDKASLNYFNWDDYLYGVSVYESSDGHVHACLFANHIIVDGIGAHLFVSGMYDLLSSGECQVPLLTLDECVEEEMKYHAGPRSDRHKQFWQDKVEKYEGVALTHAKDLQPDQLRTENYVVKVNEELTKKVVAFCQENNLSMTQLLSALLLIYKAKMTNKNSVAISLPIHARSNHRKKTVLSTFVRALPLMAEIDGESTVLEYMEYLKSELAQLMRHYKVSRSDLIECMKGVSGLDDLSISVQVNDRFMERYSAVIPDGGWVMPKESPRPLTIHVKEETYLYEEEETEEDKLYLDYEFLPSLFDEKTVVDMHEKMERILSQVVGSTAKQIKDITLIDDEEYHWLMNAPHGDDVAYRKPQTIVETFEEQVVKHGEKTALIYEDVILTYEELNAKANQLAHYLIETFDIQPEDKVGLLLDRSEGMIVSILAVLKAGAAYVPMSPKHPADRIAYIAETTEFKTALVEPHYASRLANVTVVRDLDLCHYPTSNPETELQAENLAYVIFTSGTTGNPKGVMIEHRQINGLIPSMMKAYGFEEKEETILFFSNYVFDPSVEQIFLALSNGYKLVVSPDGLWMDQERFIAYLNQHQVTYIAMTASLLFQLDLSSIPSLNYVVSGGEAVTAPLLDKVRHQPYRFINVYGPTEATVTTTTHVFENLEEGHLIGRPLANMTIYVLDGFKRPVPKGTIGELYIGGIQVSRGYIKQPELTLERFITNPYQTEAQKLADWNARLYQTGDLVRMLEDGRLEYHGRNDFQVKIRGYRIELGEIEAALLQVPEVKQAHVMALGDVGSQYLGAYYVSDEEIAEEKLDQELGRKLPEYMIPSGYQHMSSFPLTVNGKLDRRALPEINFDGAVEYVAPTTEMETLVASSFEEILEGDQVGINDNFFKLGGHSLRALRLTNLLEEKTGKAIQVKHVFEWPKVSQLASLLEELGERAYERIPKAEEKSVYEMSSTQKRMYLLWKLSPSETTYHMPAVLTFDQRLDERKLTVAINELSARHDILRTTFVEKDGRLLQVIHDGVTTNVLVTEMRESEIKEWQERAVQPFDLEKGLLYRVEIARTPEKDYLFVDMHHIISDGMSSVIFVNELNALVGGVQLPPLDRQYKDYSKWMRSLDLSPSENHWLRSLEDYPVLELPLDYPRPLIQNFEGSTVNLILGEKVTKQVKELIRKTGTTEYMFFMGVISILLGKLSNQRDLVIGSPVSGRVHRDTETMLGMFINTLAMRVKPEGTKTFSAYLEELKTQTLEGQDHQVYPFEDLVEKLVDSRNASRNPLFDVLLVYQNNEAISSVLGATAVEEFNAPAKFDLMFTLSDDGKETRLELTYATSLFKEETIQTYLVRFVQLLDQILLDDHQAIGELNVLLEEEQSLLVAGMGGEYVNYPKDKTIVDLFEEQVIKHPTAPAVIYEDVVLTYAELDVKANQLAHYLMETYQIQPEDRVGLLLDRSEWMIISILGAMKAGAAYVPISPEFPQERISYIEETADLKTTIVEKAYASYVKESTVIGEIDLTTFASVSPETGLVSTNLAYVFFTSGTTGNPKGVMIEHHQVNNVITSMRENYGFEVEGERFLFFSNYVFDVSIEQIFLALMYGDPLIVMPDDLWMDQEKFIGYLNAHQVTYVHMTPSFLTQIDLSPVETLKRVVIVGESVTPYLVEKVAKHNAQLINGYGPTEATVVVTWHSFGETEERNLIGVPLANTTIYILDEFKRPVPKGTIGEMYIGGVQVSRGYIKREDLTAEKFVPNPYQTEEQKLAGWNDLIYQTGDLVRLLEDGTLEYHGRNDFQVKIRGYRIELAEIEGALSSIEGITHVHVMALGEKGSQYLGAYYVSDAEISREVLDQELNGKLPSYMVPSAYQHMTEFPLTVNGKLDRRALPEIGFDSTVAYVTPATEMEEIVSKAYAEVLDVAQVGSQDDFFQLGGHSLRALRLTNLLEEKTGKQVQVRHVFEASKVVRLASVLEGLGASNYERIPKAEKKSYYEMSSTQKRMYLLWKYAPQETNYNMPATLRLDKRLDEAKLTKALHQLVKRHEIMRTTFTEQDGQLVQVISASVKTNVLVTEIAESEVKRWRKKSVKPFNLEEGPLHHIEIARTPACDYLFVDMHHIVSDGMSSTIFVSELNALMSGFTLPTLDRQYKDYSEWMKDQDLSASEAYWLTSLDEYPVLNLPTTYQRPIDQRLDGDNAKLILDEVTTTKIKTLVKQTNATEYMFFMGLISILLGKLANQDDLVIGSPVSGRIHRDTESMLGMFVNTLAMRVKPEGNKTFVSYLEELKAQTLEAQEHQVYPFEDLVELAARTRDRSRSPLFDVLVVYQNNEEANALGGATMLQEFNVPAKFDLSFTLSDDGNQTLMDLNYATSLFSASTIRTYLNRFMQLLDQILEDVSQPIKDLDVLLDTEKQTLLEDLGEYTPYSVGKTIVDVFEEQVTKNPTKAALVYKDISYTYEELNAITNQLAHYLIDEHGVKPETTVGLLLDRSEWMVISILGVLKSGAAYVPISPEFPEDRISYIEEMAEFKTALVEAEYASNVTNPTVIRDLDLSGYPTTTPVMEGLTPASLAYIIFTSGTTGKPKGVMLEHRHVNNLVPALVKDYLLEEEETILFFSNYVFDVSVEQIFLGLLNGYPLITTPDRLWMDQEAFTNYLNDNQVTYVHTTPSLLSQIDVSGVPSIKRTIVAGESVNPALVQRMHEEGMPFINAYGPTEATVISTVHRFDGPETRNLIGKALQNTTVYVLDENKQPVPLGTSGELYLGGVQLARGYIKREDLTNQVFVPNPHQTKQQKAEGWNERIYKTGDIVRFLEDGSIEYEGRSDFQVKIRGYRIELGEIEGALLSLPGVTQAHVMALGESTNQYLGAYYVSSEELTKDELDQALASKLPEYMIPSAYQHMVEFPVTVNGKLDRRALPEIGFDSSEAYVAPATEMEEVVAQAYAEILGIDPIGSQDDFFQLGGHSLRALRLVNLLEEKTGKSVQVRHVFEASKVAQLALILEGLGEANYERIPKAEEKDAYEMSSAQKRMYLLWKFTPAETNYNMPAMLSFDRQLDELKLTEAINKLAARHEILRTTFTEQEGQLVQVISVSVKVNVLVSEMDESDVKLWYQRAVRPFNLEEGPMYRIEIARTPEKDYLFVDMHHIISDGMSNAIFVQEINALMEGMDLPTLDRQYKDYSEWMNTQDLSASESYWLENLENYPMLELQTDFTRPLTQQFEAGAETLLLGEATTKRIKNFIQQTNTTEYMFFMGLISILLGKLANQDDLVIGSPVSGRIHRDTETMLGMFVNTLVMRVKPEREKTFAIYLEELKAQTLEAQNHQLYPFEDLVEKLVDNRDASRNPLFDVLLVYQNNEDLAPVMGGASFQETEAQAKFDLTFTLSDDGKETTIDLAYATSLFSKSTIKTYLERLTLLLNQILADTNLPIKELDTVLEAERTLILGEFNNTTTEFPADLSIAEQFEAQVKLTPTKVAVEDKNSSLTYAELDGKANGVAQALIDNGLQSEDFVAIVAKRNVDTVIGFLAALKAGGAYMPIDADYPESRISFMLEDSEAKIILGTEGDLPVSGDYIFIDPPSVTSQEKAPTVDANGSSLAYLIYTSGTTGNPKGVMIEQQSITRLVKNTNYADFNDVRILQTGSLSFDASTFEIWGALLNGGYAFITDMNVLVDDAKLKSMIADLSINTMWLTVALYNHLVTVDVSVFDALSTLLTGGETLSRAHVDRLLHHRPSIRLVNCYGPTETTTFATTFPMMGPLEGEKLPIGKPISNTQLYVMNDNTLSGIGVPGELLIGGPGVARGYLNNPELTAEKFIDNPFGVGKLYRTGDLISWLPDGNIAYLGRMDDQVKVRGHRIELGEIESALRALPEIDHAVVLVREGQLHAYLQNPTSLPHEEIKSRLNVTLPDYMIPTHFMDLETFPVTSNGKVNKRALPIIEVTHIMEYVAPSTEMEEIVVQGYEEILELDQVGINDDFFLLGGHSLRALRLVNLLEERTGKAIEIRHIFETSKVIDLAKSLESLSDATYERIPLAPEKPFYEMSSTQKRMYLLWKFSPNEITYNMPVTLTFDRRLDESKLTAAIDLLVHRHEILRTTFTEQDGQLRQIISESQKSHVVVTEVEDSEVKDWYESRLQPFHLENGPMYRVEIARTPEKDHLFVDMHHIISDGMSSTIFVNEINQLMSDAELPVLDRQYKDYSEWMAGLDLSGSESYWTGRLEDYPVLELQTDHVRPINQRFEGAKSTLTLGSVTTAKIKDLIRKTNSTEYMFFMGLISILLGKLANQEDLVIGSPVSGRIHRDTESMLGMFVNTLAMRVKPEGTKTFASYLEELKMEVLEAQAHQIYPFEELVEKLVNSRDSPRTPLFDVLMVYQNNESLAPVMGSNEMEECEALAKFDLTFTLFDDGTETFIDLTYATSLFNAATIEMYLTRLMQLLDQILEDASQTIQDLNVLLPREEQELVENMGSQYVAYPKDKTLMDLFEEQVDKTPGATALVYKDVRLTYAELNAKANQLAHYLIGTYDIKPEDKIGLLLDRSEWMIIGILGVLKAGAAYVPISPEHPKDRMVYMAETAAFKTALVEPHYASSVAKAEVLQEIHLNNYPMVSPETDLKSNNLAYILFTSGTTGRPKGVMLEHHHVNNLIPAMKQIHNLKDEGETILFFTNYVFDPSVEQIFLPLLNGYTMVVSPDNLWMDPAAFTSYLNTHQVTYIHMTPSMLLLLDLDNIPTLKNVVSGGESVTSNLLDKVRDLDFHFVNLYGPTEATVNSTSHLIDVNEKRNVIGKELPNMTLYVLDDNRRLVPKGTIGELYVGGVQVSRGYVSQSDLTAERFISNPFQTVKQKAEGWNARLYQTGDLVRMLEDGTLEYIGRTDFQVKIRGHRVELGEIEETLLQIPEIKQVHAMALDKMGSQYLGTYYVSDMEISEEFLDQTIGSKLPDYMIPSGYQHMTEFPLTVNGKLDRRALPEIGFDSTVEYVAPTTEIEKIIAKSFEEVLGLDQVGIHDDFFKLGGHSLRALRLVNLLEEKTGKAVGVKHVFEASKVTHLARLLEDLGEAEAYERIPKAEEKDVYDMSPSQRRMYTFWKYRMNKDGIGYSMPVKIKLQDRLDASQVTKAFEKLVARHEIYRTTFHEKEGRLIQVIHDTMPVHVKMVDVKEADVETWFNQTVKSFDLEAGPLYRVEIFRTETHDHLFLDYHHIISDGRSNINMTREMFYFLQGLDLPPLDRQYRDYSEWLRVQDLSGSETYWLESMKDYPVLALDLDYPRPPLQDFVAGRECMVLDEQTTTGIRALLKKTNATEYMFFLAMISILLGKYADQEDVVIGSPMSGRIHRDLDEMLGMIVNTLPMRVAPMKEKPFNTYLAEIKAQTLTAYDHQTYPLDVLRKQLIEIPDLSRHELYDVLYVYQNNEQLDTEFFGIIESGEYNIPEKLDLNYTLSNNGKETSVLLTYATALFKRETILVYQASLRKLIDQVLEDAELTIGELEV